jgi:drug/metabolite transporter (DMT)-like permease
MVWSMIMFGEIPTTLLFIGGTVTIVGLVLYLMGSMGMLRRKQ